MGTALIVIGIIVALYGMTIMFVGSGSWFFAFWYALGGALIALGWLLNSGTWETLPLVLRRAVEVAGGLFVVFMVATQIMVASEFGSRGDDDLDYLIVLGAQVRQSGPSIALRSRLDAAYDYLTRNERTVCIVSGGQGSNEPTTEADAMASYLIERGIDPSRIIREDQSLNTTQNIGNSRAFLDPARDRVGIVTSSYHLFRAKAIARKHGIAHLSGIASGATPYYLPNNMARESFGLVKDFVFGNL